MKRALLSIFTLLSFFSCFAQSETVTLAKLKFELPNNKWKINNDEFKQAFIYNYEREAIIDKQGTRIIPVIAFIVETIPAGTDVVQYSIAKRSSDRRGLKISEVFSWDTNKTKITYKNAVGYKGTYIDDDTGKEHTIYWIHLINNDKGVQVIMDMTSELVVKYGAEFLKSIESIRSY